MFFGGWSLFGLEALIENPVVAAVVKLVILVGKMFLLVFLALLVRWTIPRFRFDQLMNMAWKVLKSRLYALEMRKQQGERDKIEAGKADISFGSQIRNYVLAPYRMVKDVRTGVESGNTDAVLDGELDPFITAYLLGVRRKDRAPLED